ncbi:MAG: peptidoglycan-binding protein [Patescibacteria group bacterium]
MKKYLIIGASLLILGAASVAGAQGLSFSHDLTVGSSGSEVSALQSYLMSQGFDIPAIRSGVTPPGYFGMQTVGAVQRYQAANGVPATGYVGPLTRARLNGGDTRGASLRVTSPNGGEVLSKGSNYQIAWTGAPGILNNQTGSIWLQSYIPPCAEATNTIRCMIAVPEPRLVAPGIQLSSGSFSWIVGEVANSACPGQARDYKTYNGVSYCVGTVPDGQYKIRICPTNTNACDTSDAYFQVNSGVVSTGAPVINGIDAPTTLTVGQTGTWTVRASDPQQGTLSYSVSWGDEVGYGSSGVVSMPTAPIFTQTSTFTHSYSRPGTYTVNFSVRNNLNLAAQTSATVNVTGNTTTGYFKVISPNGGEVWDANSNKTISWSSSAYNDFGTAGKVDIDLGHMIYPPCVAPIDSRPSSCGPLFQKLYTLDKNINANTPYYWIVATDISNNAIPAGDYAIRICAAGTETNCDVSDAPFTIRSSSTAGPLRVTSPNGGEVWQQGTTRTITWTSPSYFRATYADIKISRIPDACINRVPCPYMALAPFTIVSNIPINQNSYNWTVGSIVAECPAGYSCLPVPLSEGQYTIQICETGTDNCDSSDSSFGITSTYTQPRIELSQPDGGEVWNSLSTQIIRWNIVGSSDPNVKVDLNLTRYVTCLPGTTCLPSPYVLDRNISGNQNYYWIVATDINNNRIPPGQFKVTACLAGTNTCSSSDNWFTIQ